MITLYAVRDTATGQWLKGKHYWDNELTEDEPRTFTKPHYARTSKLWKNDGTRELVELEIVPKRVVD